jgi:uncharacterized protein involved in outer membrane biogenesis
MKKKIALVFLLILVAFRLYLPTLLKNYANKELNTDPVYHGNIEDVQVHLWRGAYSAINLKIVETAGQKTFPFLSAHRIDVSLSWRDLFHNAIVAKMNVEKLEINIVQEPKPEGKKIVLGEPSKAGKVSEAHGWQDVFKKLVPLDVNSLVINDGSIHFRDLTSQPKINVFIDQLKVRATNLTNSVKVAASLFGTVDAEARVMESGELNLELFINPLVSPPEFKATVKLRNLDLTQLNGLFTAYAKFDVKEGQFSLYSEMATAHGNLEGYVKPLVEGLRVSDFKKDENKGGLIHAFWEQIVGAIGGIFKNYPKDRQAAVIRFGGKLNDPKTNGWEIAKSVLHNMFVRAIKPGIENSVKLHDVKK